MYNIIKISIFVVIGLLIAVQFFYSMKAMWLYITDGADSRTPSLVTSSLILIVTYFIIFFDIFIWLRVSNMIGILISIEYFTFISLMYYSRSMGFQTIKPKTLKDSIIYTLLYVYFIFIISVGILKFHYTEILIIPEIATFQSVSFVLTKLIDPIDFESGAYTAMIFYSSSLVFNIAILIFDLREKRSKLTIKYDLLSFSVPIIFMIFGLLNSSYNTFVISIIILVYAYTVQSLIIRKNLISVLKRARGINIKIQSFMDGLKNIRKTNSAELLYLKFKSMKNLIENDIETQNILEGLCKRGWKKELYEEVLMFRC
jgi:hypothetical protein